MESRIHRIPWLRQDLPRNASRILAYLQVLLYNGISIEIDLEIPTSLGEYYHTMHRSAHIHNFDKICRDACRCIELYVCHWIYSFNTGILAIFSIFGGIPGILRIPRIRRPNSWNSFPEFLEFFSRDVAGTNEAGTKKAGT